MSSIPTTRKRKAMNGATLFNERRKTHSFTKIAGHNAKLASHGARMRAKGHRFASIVTNGKKPAKLLRIANLIMKFERTWKSSTRKEKMEAYREWRRHRGANIVKNKRKQSRLSAIILCIDNKKKSAKTDARLKKWNDIFSSNRREFGDIEKGEKLHRFLNGGMERQAKLHRRRKRVAAKMNIRSMMKLKYKPIYSPLSTYKRGFKFRKYVRFDI